MFNEIHVWIKMYVWLFKENEYIISFTPPFGIKFIYKQTQKVICSLSKHVTERKYHEKSLFPPSLLWIVMNWIYKITTKKWHDKHIWKNVSGELFAVSMMVRESILFMKYSCYNINKVKNLSFFYWKTIWKV